MPKCVCEQNNIYKKWALDTKYSQFSSESADNFMIFLMTTTQRKQFVIKMIKGVKCPMQMINIDAR